MAGCMSELSALIGGRMTEGRRRRGRNGDFGSGLRKEGVMLRKDGGGG